MERMGRRSCYAILNAIIEERASRRYCKTVIDMLIRRRNDVTRVCSLELTVYREWSINKPDSR